MLFRSLFFESDNVDQLREAVITRGGEPSELEKVNWIKMRMFQLRDPDGHIVWFGQSFHDPGPDPAAHPYADARIPAGRGQLRAIMPEFPLDDVSAGIAYYRDVLGFTVNYQQHDLGVMDRDEARILLIQRTPEHSGIGACYLYIRDADALHAELTAKGAKVQGKPVSQPWGLRDFSVLDPEGNRLTFGQTFE